MADYNLTGPLRNHGPLSNPPPPMQPQDPETLTPSYLNYNPPPTHNNHDPPPTFPQLPSHYRTQLPESPMYAAYLSNRLPFPVYGASRTAGFYAPAPGGMFQHRTEGAQSSNPNPTHLPNPYLQTHPYLDSPPYLPPARPSATDDPPQPNPPRQNTMHSVSPPPQSQWLPSSIPDFYRHSSSSSASTASLRPFQPINVATPPPSTADGRPMRSGPINMEFRHPYGLTRPTQNQRPPTHTSRIPGRESAEPSFRRPERSMSPRTSHRRSFDRYSTDLSTADSSAESDEPHTPSHRSSRRRIGDATDDTQYRMLMMANRQDPNVPSTQQIQQLKDRLIRYVRSELEEGTSTACDICQKDYSKTLVQPSEDAEVAVKLPCKHVFGEHCMHTWFDTCKTHKNKVTCPMCRTLLIQPSRRRQQLMQVLSQAGYQGVDGMLFREHRRVIETLVGRDLEGDFAHP
ncbi:hypothetical protein DM02DRAFT_650285 [Periconia macrospinosa]|uniref:RING-type domain-containing protein n=1 Tax=Periconia macrospinosa TaxID=97972 RepID=A0A2V1E8M4_9PLEO|nr:hypothetical protein DM02DRAFT_650285 [Periconia macrospinosa]